MGLFIPRDFDLERRVEHNREKHVLRILADGLSDEWHIIPNLEIAGETRMYEADIILFHREYGIALLEVKGGRITVEDGEWYQNKKLLPVSPAQQARNAMFKLREELRAESKVFQHIGIATAVVFPDVSKEGFTGTLDVEPHQLLGEHELQSIRDAIIDLFLNTITCGPLSDEQVTDFVEIVRPNVNFRWDPEALAIEARVSLNRIMREQTRALATLDRNDVAFVHGAAGTGKTRLALQWARRALDRNERTLITCYNVPLGDFIATQFDEHEEIHSGHFGEIMPKLMGHRAPDTPANAGNTWFYEELPARFIEFARSSNDRFDTIIIDEVQDFPSTWVDAARTLLAEGGRILTVGDNEQNLFDREGVKTILSLSPAKAELVTNCRNTQHIGNALHALGGAPVAAASPEGDGVYTAILEDGDEVAEVVYDILEGLINDEVRNPSNIAVVTTRSDTRTTILNSTRDGLTCARWEEMDDDSVLCETIHRTKGLEFDVVVLVATEADPEERLLYVGASRAVSRLVVVGNKRCMERMGLRVD